jgi:hypothetical protein
LPKQPPPPEVTAPKVAKEASKQLEEKAAAKVVACFIAAVSQSTSVPPTEPSPCPAAGEDELTPKAEPVCMDWLEDTSNALPPIDFDSKERSSGSSIHCADNAMTDDTPGAVSSFRDANSGTICLSPSSSPPPETAPQSEVAQLFQLIMATIKPIKTELKCIGDKVDSRVPHRPTPTMKKVAGPWAVTDLQGPPSEPTQTEKLKDLKMLAQRYARDRGSCDDTWISYLEFVESEAEADLTLVRMISG